MADAPFADTGEILNWHHPGEPNFDSTDNVYLDIIQTLHQHSFKSGAYSADWSTVSLPSSPVEGLPVARFNTDTNTLRIYWYDDSGGWQELSTLIDHNTLINTHNLTSSIDHNTINNNHNLTTNIDHNTISNYDANRHLLQSGMSLASLGTRLLANLSDVSLTGALLEDGLLYQAANADWITCIFTGDASDQTVVENSGGRIINNSATDILPQFWLPLPTALNGLSLTVTDIRFTLVAADGSDFITLTRVFGTDSTGITEKYNDPANIDTTGVHTSGTELDAMTDFDASSFGTIVVYLSASNATTQELIIVDVQLKVYYS